MVDQKEILKSHLGKALDLIVNNNQKKTEPYFVFFHDTDDKVTGEMRQKIKILDVIPGFVTGSIVFWVCNKRGICEWLWTVSKSKKIEFNNKGVAYLQAKGAMPKSA